MKSENYFLYLPNGQITDAWGVCVTSIGHLRVLPGAPYPPGGHPVDHTLSWERGRVLSEHQIVYISEGSGRFESPAGQPYRITAGSAFLLFPGVWHRYEPRPETGWVEDWVELKGPAVEKLTAEGVISPDNPVMHIGASPEVRELLNESRALAESTPYGYQPLLGVIGLQILARILLAASAGSEVSETTEKIRRGQAILAATHQAPPMEQLAQEVGMSYSHFRRAFKATTGLNPKQYHLNLRLRRAQNLLDNSSRPLKEIAEELGFDSAFHLSADFKARTGLSPAQWRLRRVNASVGRVEMGEEGFEPGASSEGFSMNPKSAGLIAAPFTPFHGDGSLNLAQIDPLMEALLANQVAGAFVCGTTGEWASLTLDERMAVAARWCDAAPADFPVLVHVGHHCQADAITLAKHAQSIGASGIAAMAPSFFKPAREEDLVRFLVPIAAAAPEVPFYYYTFPTMTGGNLLASRVLERGCDSIPNLAGVKFTHDDIVDYEKCLRFDGGRFRIFFGRDELLLEALELGGRDTIGGAYNVAAPVYNRITEAFLAGDLESARRHQDLARRFTAIFNGDFGWMSSVKAVMQLLKLNCGPVRPPLRELRAEEIVLFERELDAAGFFEAIHPC